MGKKIKIRGIEFEVSDDALHSAIVAESARADQAEALATTEKARADKAEGQAVALRAEADKARQDAAAGASPDRVAEAAKARLAVLRTGAQAGMRLDEMEPLSDHQIRVEVVKRHTGTDMAAKPPAAVEGAFEVVAAEVAKRLDAGAKFAAAFEGPVLNGTKARQDADPIKTAESKYFESMAPKAG